MLVALNVKATVGWGIGATYASPGVKPVNGVVSGFSSDVPSAFWSIAAPVRIWGTASFWGIARIVESILIDKLSSVPELMDAQLLIVSVSAPSTWLPLSRVSGL